MKLREVREKRRDKYVEFCVYFNVFFESTVQRCFTNIINMVSRSYYHILLNSKWDIMLLTLNV